MSADSGDVADSGRRQGARRRLVAEKISDTGRPCGGGSRTEIGRAAACVWRRKHSDTGRKKRKSDYRCRRTVATSRIQDGDLWRRKISDTCRGDTGAAAGPGHRPGRKKNRRSHAFATVATRSAILSVGVALPLSCVPSDADARLGASSPRVPTWVLLADFRMQGRCGSVCEWAFLRPLSTYDRAPL